MNNIEILKKILIEKLNYKRDYSHTIILEERRDSRLYINQYIPLKIYKGKDLYSGIHVQSIEIDPEFTDRIYIYQYLNKRDAIDEKVFGLKTPIFEAGWSRSISSIKGKMKIKEREKKGEVLFKDNFPKMKPLVVSWNNDMKDNTRNNSSTMYVLYWDLGTKGNLHYSLCELLEDGTSRFIINQENDLEKVSELLADDEEYEYLDLPEDQELLIPSFIKLMSEDKQLRHIVRTLASEDGKDSFEASDYIKKESESSNNSSKFTSYNTAPPQPAPMPKEESEETSRMTGTTFTKLLDKLLDCEVEIPEDEMKFLVKFIMEYYEGDNLKFVLNKLTQE